MTLTLELSDEEARVFAEMRRSGIFPSDVDVLKAALVMYAWHFHIDLPLDCFAIGRGPAVRSAAATDVAQPDLFSTDRAPVPELA